jgi:hypothetical protein
MEELSFSSHHKHEVNFHIDRDSGVLHCNQLVVLLEKPWKRKEQGLLAVLSLSLLFLDHTPVSCSLTVSCYACGHAKANHKLEKDCHQHLVFSTAPTGILSFFLLRSVNFRSSLHSVNHQIPNVVHECRDAAAVCISATS